MALSIAELELETTEFLPAREVMSTHKGCGCGSGTEQENNAWFALVQQNANNGGENHVVEVYI